MSDKKAKREEMGLFFALLSHCTHDTAVLLLCML
jgi:hypothetical protein